MAAVDDRWWTEEDEGGQPTSATKIVQEMAGKTIRLVSVHWSTARRNEYLYSPGHDYSSRRRMALSWKEEVQGDILAKSRYLVELVPGEDDQIRLVSVHWSAADRNEYLYSSAIDWGGTRRMVLSWKGEVQSDILSKSRYRVEFPSP